MADEIEEAPRTPCLDGTKGVEKGRKVRVVVWRAMPFLAYRMVAADADLGSIPSQVTFSTTENVVVPVKGEDIVDLSISAKEATRVRQVLGASFDSGCTGVFDGLPEASFEDVQFKVGKLDRVLTTTDLRIEEAGARVRSLQVKHPDDWDMSYHRLRLYFAQDERFAKYRDFEDSWAMGVWYQELENPGRVDSLEAFDRMTRAVPVDSGTVKAFAKIFDSAAGNYWGFHVPFV